MEKQGTSVQAMHFFYVYELHSKQTFVSMKKKEFE